MRAVPERFRRDLEARDDLERLVREVEGAYAEDLRSVVARLDGTFRDHTRPDPGREPGAGGGSASAARSLEAGLIRPLSTAP
ncbi:hypothetical protein [Streptomyces sp. NPDC005799]|uniref:hypothetical protein n=1 Tax=Streptomyces sp. NPDC005799 TaxID=3154678 RepID=UPI0033DD5BC0